MTATGYVDACGFIPASSGTGNFVVSAAITGYQTPASAGAVNTTVYSYRAESSDKTQWEEGYGAYTVSTTTLARTTITANSSGGTSAINFTAAPNVFITAMTADLQNASLLATGTVSNSLLGFPPTPQGRITLTSATPVLTSTVSGATTVYYTPYVGSMVPLYNGTNFVPTIFAEVSQATTDTTKSPAAVAASSVYDLFAWSDSGTIRVTRGPAWTNSTTRSLSLTMVNGIQLNASAITNGPATQRGTWVGTIASNGSSTIDYIFGASAAGGTAGSFGVWNAYNRRFTTTFVADTNNNYAYATASWRAADNSSGMRVTAIFGANEDGVEAVYTTTQVGSGGATGGGIGLDSTTALATNCTTGVVNSASATAEWEMTAQFRGYPGLGQHYVSALEYGATSATFNTTAAPFKTGLLVSLWN